MILTDLLEDGFAVLKFNDLSRFEKLQNLIQTYLSFAPSHWHLKISSQEEHHQLIVELSKQIAQSNLLIEITQEHHLLFKELYGPDIDIQTIPDLRISRPGNKRDLVTWHRDTFYGCSPWQINIWFPLFDLPAGAGLLLLPGSHRQPSTNLRSILKSNFPSEMRDDQLEAINSSQIKLLTPRVGESVIFFGCGLHRAINPSQLTRLSLDVRLRSAPIPNAANEGFQPFSRGIVGQCVQSFHSAGFLRAFSIN